MFVLDYCISVFLTISFAFGALAIIYGWWKTPIYRARPGWLDYIKVSIIIAARNEEDTIPLILADLLAQDYPSEFMEIIVVDDHSNDSTALKVLEFEKFGVKLIQLNESNALNSYKKKAISVAIDQSKGEFILTTDADCRMGPKWVKTMTQFYREGEYKMVSAGVAFLEDGSPFQKFQSMEFSMLIGLGAAAIQIGNPFTCNGANLGYSKSAFYELGGFKGIDDLASGDDELLLHKVASHFPGKIGFVKSRDALIFTHAKTYISEFIKQRRRWASKSVKYRNRRMIIFSVGAFFFNAFILLNFILGLFFPELRPLFLVQIGTKIVLELFIMAPVLKFMGQLKFLIHSLILLPIYFIAYIFYIVYIGIVGNSGKYEWKGRMVR